MRALALVPLLLALAGCGGDRAGNSEDGGTTAAQSDLSGAVSADGSSTVGPYATAAAEQFRSEAPNVRVTVGVSGTGGGFERFCAGETDLSNASRPIEADERQACTEKGIQFVELTVANKDNDWATCLTVAQLKKIWDRGSKVKTWKDVDAKFPAEPMKLYGPGTDSGTFDYFTAEINGEEGQSRSDYSASEDDNVIVQGVAGDKGALGYFGLSYYEQNQDKLKALEVDGGDGCVAPAVESAQTGAYKPLSRPLFVYVKKESLQRPEVRAFVEYILENEQSIAEAAQFVPLTDEQLERAKSDLAAASA